MLHARIASRRLLLAGIVVAAAAALLSGCARITAVSEVKPDGSFTRTLTIAGSEPPESGDGAAAGGGMGMAGPKLSRLVNLPTAAGGWTVAKKSEIGNLTVTATKTIAPGQEVRNDLGIQVLHSETPPPPPPPAKPAKKTAGAAKPAPGPELQVENVATVRQIAPGQYEYREVLHWRGAKPDDMDAPDADMAAALKKALPPALAAGGDAAAAAKVKAAVKADLWHLMFGPSEPLLPTIMAHPDLANYKIESGLRGSIFRALKATYGDRITEEEAAATATKMAGSVASSATDLTKKGAEAGPASGAEDSREKPPVALLFRVKLPGKVTASNGQVDPVTGEVVWALYSQSAALEDVTLTATSQTDAAAPKP